MRSVFDPAPKLPMTPGERWGLVIGIVVITSLFVAEVVSQSQRAMFGMLFLVLAFVPLLVIHELGHATAARMVGWRISDIVIGFGRELFQFRVGNTRVRIKLGPIEGYVVTEPRTLAGARFKSAFVYFAGPGAEILVFVAIYSLYGSELFAQGGSLDRLAAQAVSAAIGLSLFSNLIPRPWGQTINDGHGIVLSLVSGNESFASWLNGPALRDARRCLWLEDPAGARRALLATAERAHEDLRIAGLLGVCKALEGDADGARKMLAELLEAAGPGFESVELAMAQAWIDVISGRVDIMTLRDAAKAASRIGGLDANLLCAWIKLELGRSIEAYRQAMVAYRLAREAEDEGPCLAVLALASDAVLGYGDAAVGVVQADFPSRFAAALARRPLGPKLRQRVAALS